MALLQDYNKLFEYTDNIKKIYVNNSVVWPAAIEPGHDYSEPFYVENISNETETLSIRKPFAAPTLTIEYSTDKATWITFGTTSTTALTMTLQPNDKIYLRCTTERWASSNSNTNSITGISKVGGNIMSLLYGNNFADKTSFPNLTSTSVLSGIFRTNVNLIDASDLLLPAITLNSSCYNSMFFGCSLLVSAPALPATTLVVNCYNSMFSGCSSLVSAPVLPATTLAVSCYSRMFNGCTSLTTAPALPATTLADSCYSVMFYGCNSLTSAPVLPATTLADSCYGSMFQGCTSLTTAPALPATTLAYSCYSNMFQNCRSLIVAPELPATTLAESCYLSMFENCRSLTTAPDLPATTLLVRCYQYMFRNCSALNTVKCLANESNTSATNSWLSAVSSTGTFTKAAGVTWPRNNSGIPSGWTVIDV